MRKSSSHPPSVIIIGAGAAGLTAAQILSRHGCAVVILEARRRIGGRIESIHHPMLPIPVEMGAEFIHGKPHATLQIVQEAGLTPVRVPFEHMKLHGGKLAQASDYPQRLQRAMSGLSRIGRADISFADYIRSRQHGRAPTPDQKLALDFTQGFDAADPERISARSIAAEQQELGDVQNEPQFRLLNGYGAMIEHLHRSLSPARVKIHLDRVVSEIIWKKNQVEVRCRNTPDIFTASRALITLPLGVLQLPPESPGSVRFTPDITEKRRPLSLLASGPVIKIIIIFRPEFWESLQDKMENASFIHAPELPFPTWWTASPLRLPMLTGWVGGPKAARLSGIGTNALRATAVAALSKLLGRSKKKIADGIARFHGCDWPADPFARGAYSYVTVGGSAARTALSKPMSKTLFFAGEAADTSGEASTVAGAISSGQRAAAEILSTQ